MLASLRYYWRSNLAVVLGAAVATAVLTGALLVGDSVRGSLRWLTLDRLGDIDQALVSEGFFREGLASDLANGFEGATPAILLQGSVVAAEGGRRASGVGIQAVSEGFANLYPGEGATPAPPLPFDRTEGQFFPSVVINQSLQDDLGVAVGDQVLVRLGRPSDVPHETLMGSADTGDLVQTVRAAVRAVIPDHGAGRFGLSPQQDRPRNAYLSLAEIQKALDQPGRVNALLFPRAQDGGDADRGPALESELRAKLALEDLGLMAERRGDVLAVSSRQILMRPALAEAVSAFAKDRNLPELRVSTYLANVTRPARAGSERYLPYSTISALDFPLAPGFGQLLLTDGTPAPAPGTDQILLNEWAAADLGVAAGDRIEMTYWEVGAHEELHSRTHSFGVAGITRIADLGADRKLAPDFPGIADVDDMSEWDPTFPVDLDLVRDRDEEYWDRYRATPKLFVAEPVARELWGSERFGVLTEIRLLTSEEGTARLLRDRLADDLSLPAAGLALLPVRAAGLRAAGGATDFGGLFIGFSLFLIVAAALLVGMFFRLAVERRVREIGTRLAIGEPGKRLRRGFLAEGAVLAGLGALLGSALAVGYAQLMMLGLRTLWRGAVGTSELRLFVLPASLAIGVVSSLAVVLLAVWLSVRRLSRVPVTRLLRGRRELEGARSGRRARILLWISALGSVLLFAGSFALPERAAAPLFFGLGAAVLVAGVAAFAVVAGAGAVDPVGRGRLGRILAMARANVSLNPGRSLLSVALVASAAFVIVAVGSYGHDLSADTRDRDSGTGGFQLVAEADIPIVHDVTDEAGRAELGFDGEAEALLGAAEIYPLRLMPGDDVSCLNLYQPRQPRLLGVPASLRDRGGFEFLVLAEGADPGAPWKLLDQDLAAEQGAPVVPAFGDYNSVMWILKSGLGKDVEITDELGRPLRLRLVGLMHKSLFQSELLISEEQFLRHFPSRTGYQELLVATAPGAEQATSDALEEGLGDYGLDVSDAGQRLQSFQAVENTYLSTFQTLGGLGLLLGTVGLAVILLRNVLERTSELATLRALGYRRSTLGWVVFAENAVVLAVGLVIGTAAALVAVAPHLEGGRAVVPWLALALTLSLCAAVGLSASGLAVRQALRLPLLPSLRAE